MKNSVQAILYCLIIFTFLFSSCKDSNNNTSSDSGSGRGSSDLEGMTSALQNAGSGNNSFDTSTLNKINEKLDRDGIEGEFSQEEFAAMINYIERCLPKIKNIDDYDEWEKRFPHLDQYFYILSFAQGLDILNQANSSRFDKLMNHIRKEMAAFEEDTVVEEVAVAPYEYSDSISAYD